jgi:lambda family phage tail tape measure protein
VTTFNIVISGDPGPARAAIGTVDQGLATLGEGAKRLADLLGKASRLDTGAFNSGKSTIVTGLQNIEAQAKRTAAAVKALAAEQTGNFRGAGGGRESWADFTKGFSAQKMSSLNAEAEKLLGTMNGTATAGRGMAGALGQVATAGGQAATGMDLLKANLASMGIAEAAHKLVDLGREILAIADEYENLQNKLRNVTSGEQDLHDTEARLFKVAQETRQSYESIVTIYQRTSNAVAGLGYSQADTAKFTERLSKLIATSGATSTEAAQAMIQLSQGMGRGVLQGQDLKAVLEDVPAIGHAIANAMGVSFGKLKELGAEGKITTQQIVDAMNNATDIDEKFANAHVTVGQVWTQVQNKILQSVGELTADAGPELEKLEKSFEALVDAIIPMVKPLLEIVAASGAKEIQELANFLVANARAMDNMWSALGRLVPGLQDLAKAAVTAEGPLQAIADVLDATVNATEDLATVTTDSMDKAQRAHDVAVANAEARAAIAGADKALAQSAQKDWERTFYWLKNTQKSLTDAYKAQVEEGKKAAQYWKGQKQLFANLYEAADPYAKALNDVARAQDLVNKVVAKYPQFAEAGRVIMEHAHETANKLLDPLAQYRTGLQDEIDLLTLTSGEREKANFLRQAEESLISRHLPVIDSEIQKLSDLYDQKADLERIDKRREEQAKAEDDLLGMLRPKQDAYTTSVATLNGLWAEGRVTADEYRVILSKLGEELGPKIDIAANHFKSFNAGVYDGLMAIGDEIKNVGSDLQQVFVTAFDGISQAITDMVVKGKADWKSLADSILGELTKILLKMLLLKTIGALFPKSDFGAVSSGFGAAGGRRGLHAGCRQWAPVGPPGTSRRGELDRWRERRAGFPRGGVPRVPRRADRRLHARAGGGPRPRGRRPRGAPGEPGRDGPAGDRQPHLLVTARHPQHVRAGAAPP